MTQRVFLDFLHILERLKCNTRHSWTSTGRHETVAAHTWRLAVMALLLRDELRVIWTRCCDMPYPRPLERHPRGHSLL
jgi:5'-deoxynucleotidase YfbR-like HD superfamily hydrolase